MDVRCEKCDTVYDLDDDRVTEAGVEVQCKRCAHRFRVRKRPPVITREMAGLSAVSAQLSAVATCQSWRANSRANVERKVGSSSTMSTEPAAGDCIGRSKPPPCQ